MKYELFIVELDHRGVTINDKLIKETDNANDLEDFEAYAKGYYEASNPATDFKPETFFIKFVIFEDQDLELFNHRVQIRKQIEW